MTEHGDGDGALAPPALLRTPRRRRLAGGLLAAVILLLVAGVVALALLVPDPDRVMARWEETAGFDPLEAYPPRDADATARRIDRLGAPLGLTVAAPDAPRRPSVEPASRKRRSARREELEDYARALRRRDLQPRPPPDGVAATLTGVRPRLRPIAATLREAGAPRWGLHLDRGLRMEMPDLRAHRQLHRLLVLSGAVAEHRDRHQEALGWLEAAWTLRTGLEEHHPLLLSRLFAQAELGDELALLRILKASPGRWHRRLASLAPCEQIIDALRIDAWLTVQAVRAGRLAPHLGEGALETLALAPVARYGALHVVEAVERGIDLMRAADPVDFDSAALHAAMVEPIPRWSTVARSLLPNPFPSYRKAIRTGLSTELTLRVLELRAALAAGTVDPGTRSASRRHGVTGIEWIYEVTPAAVTISVSEPQPAATRDPLPLRVRVPRGGA